MTFREVTKEEFYAAMGPLDVHPQIVTRWPYTAEWRLQWGMKRAVVGKTVITEGRGTLITTYFLVEA